MKNSLSTNSDSTQTCDSTNPEQQRKKQKMNIEETAPKEMSKPDIPTAKSLEEFFENPSQFKPKPEFLFMSVEVSDFICALKWSRIP